MDNYKNHEYLIIWEKKHSEEFILEYLFCNEKYVYYIELLFLAFSKTGSQCFNWGNSPVIFCHDYNLIALNGQVEI